MLYIYLHVDIGENLVANEAFDSVVLEIETLILLPVLQSLLLAPTSLRAAIQLDGVPVPQAELLLGPHLPHRLVEDLTGQQDVLQVLPVPVPPHELEPGAELGSVQEATNTGVGNENLDNKKLV